MNKHFASNTVTFNATLGTAGAMIALTLAIVTLTACSSKPKAVNNDLQQTITDTTNGWGLVPMSKIGPPENDPQDTLKNPNHRPAIAAIQGQVLIQAGSLPSPANRAKVQLFQIKNGKENSITETTTASDGTFTFTRKLLSGNYLIKVKGKNVSAEQKFTLDNKPLQNLVIEAKELTKK